MKNERTSARVAKIAAKVLARQAYPASATVQICFDTKGYGRGFANPGVTWGDIKALAASCLTQSPDRKRPRKKPPARSAFYPAATGKRRSP